MSTSITRTRTGCWTCRSRRIKCDETHPVCRRCVRSNVTCSYGVRLTWHEESLSKGVCHGRAGLRSKKSTGQNTDGGPYRQGRRSHFRKSTSESSIGSAVPIYTWQRQRSSRPTFLNTTVRDLELYFQYENPLSDNTEQYEYEIGNSVTLAVDYHHDSVDKHTGSMPSILLPRQFSWTGPVVFRTLEYDSALLSYYEAVICSSSTLLDDARHNPYRHVILPMAMTSEGLYHATLAVSAQTLRLAEPKYRVAALEHGQRAMRCLIRILERGTNSESEIDELLGLALMLCWYEITDGCRPSWVTHLNGFRAISGRCRQLSNSASSHSASLYQFFNRYFAFHLVLARTAFRVDEDIPFCNTVPSSSINMRKDIEGLSVNPQFGQAGSETWQPSSPRLEELRRTASFSTSTNLLSLTMSLDDLDEIDPYMGFSNSLLLLINEVADLAWQDQSIDADSGPTARQIKAVRLKDALENLRQTPPLLPHFTSNSNGEDLQSSYTTTVSECVAIAEANRLGALLLLYDICSNRVRPVTVDGWSDGGSSDVTAETLPDHHGGLLPHFAGQDKDRYIGGILDLIVQNLSRMIRTAALPLWPLFLAGCCATAEEERITVMRIFDESERPKRFGNIRPAREVVEMVWRQQDLGVQDDRKRRKSAAARLRSVGRDKELNDAVYDGNWVLRPQALHADESQASSRSSSRSERFVWERAMSMLGGWKLSLT